ncbi:MAG: TRAP transporter small permease [Moorellaceae bacterium]
MSFLDRIMKFGAISSLLAMVVIVLLQVFARTFLPKVPSWTEEASRLFFIYTVCFAAGLAIKEKAYVNVDNFINLLSPQGRKYLELILDAVLFLFMALLANEAYILVLAVKGQISAALQWPMEIFYAGILLMFTFITIYLILHIVSLIKELVRKKVDEVR